MEGIDYGRRGLVGYLKLPAFMLLICNVCDGEAYHAATRAIDCIFYQSIIIASKAIVLSTLFTVSDMP